MAVGWSVSWLDVDEVAVVAEEVVGITEVGFRSFVDGAVGGVAATAVGEKADVAEVTDVVEGRDLPEPGATERRKIELSIPLVRLDAMDDADMDNDGSDIAGGSRTTAGAADDVAEVGGDGTVRSGGEVAGEREEVVEGIETENAEAVDEVCLW